MILGIGTDLVALAAFAEQLALPGSRFAEVFTARERRQAHTRTVSNGTSGQPNAVTQHLAARWAAKEALVKAWSGALYGQAPPMAETDLDWREIEVVADQWRRPALVLHGQVGKEIAALAVSSPPNTQVVAHLSLSHDGDYATATVLLEARPAA